MPVKLTDKEITALAKKMLDKQQKALGKKREELAKTKLPEAKKIKTIIDGLPVAIFDIIYQQRYATTKLTAGTIANALIEKTELNSETLDQKTFEADVVLAAHDCTTMSALCKKLEI